MPEAEEVLQDVARHTAIFVQELLQRYRGAGSAAAGTSLRDLARRLDLLVAATFGRSFALRAAEAPPPATLLARMFRDREGPRVEAAVPSTDGVSLWLPPAPEGATPLQAVQHFRLAALRMAMRAVRGSSAAWAALDDPRQKAYFLVLEAHAADAELARLLPGLAEALTTLRHTALARRPALQAFPPYRRRLEEVVRALAQEGEARPSSVDLALQQARDLARQDAPAPPGRPRRLLYRDAWTGEFRRPGPVQASPRGGSDASDTTRVPRAARLERTPRVRESPEGEDDDTPAAWMVQTSAPQEKAEDPAGLQRPGDRDASTAAEELADSLAELPEARLVRTPGRAQEVLLSEEVPSVAAEGAVAPPSAAASVLRYPEWDYRLNGYRERAVCVHLRKGAEGPQAWVDHTLAERAGLLSTVRRHFEMLRAERVCLRRQLDGDEIDLDACVAARADFMAGLPMPQALYQSHRRAKRDMAALILTDVSGSTDGWVTAHKRVVDVEREALLLVTIALGGLAEPLALQTFSGEGPGHVEMRELKGFAEPFGDAVCRRIASLEPEHYTRAGAAIRHATATLMSQGARHRLLLLLSDGRPNDVDQYEGRYGIEDTRQAVVEARLQGVSLFCLTVDRQGASYLPSVFGVGQYALLPRPELLPTALLDWMRRLMQT